MKKHALPRQANFTSAQLAGRWNIPARSLRDILQGAGVGSEDGGYEMSEAAEAVIAHFRSEATRYTDSRANALNREQQANANLAEIRLHEKLGNLVEVAQLRFYMEDLLVSMRQAILHSKELPEGIGEKVLRIIHGIKTDKPLPFAPTCPRCRKPIYDDDDQTGEILIKGSYEKNTTGKNNASNAKTGEKVSARSRSA